MTGQRSLRRRAGIEVSACAWPAVPWAEWRADPNGYYARLGLNAARPVLMWEIDSAWRRRLRELHPDTGSGDAAELARARVAYEVLSDPESRRKYDALGPSEVWMDELLLEEVLRVVTRGPEPGWAEPPAATKKAAPGTGEGRAAEPAREPHRTPAEAPQVYFWDDEGQQDPDDALALAWATEIGRALWEVLGERGRVKIGFTTGTPSAEVRAWGTVYMVPAGAEPDQATARNAVLAGEKQARNGGPRQGSAL